MDFARPRCSEAVSACGTWLKQDQWLILSTELTAEARSSVPESPLRRPPVYPQSGYDYSISTLLLVGRTCVFGPSRICSTGSEAQAGRDRGLVSRAEGRNSRRDLRRAS